MDKIKEIIFIIVTVILGGGLLYSRYRAYRSIRNDRPRNNKGITTEFDRTDDIDRESREVLESDRNQYKAERDRVRREKKINDRNKKLLEELNRRR